MQQFVHYGPHSRLVTRYPQGLGIADLGDSEPQPILVANDTLTLNSMIPGIVVGGIKL